MSNMASCYVPFSRFLASCSGVRLATPLLPGPVFFFFLAASSSAPTAPDSGDMPLLLLTVDSTPGLGAISSEVVAMGSLSLGAVVLHSSDHSWGAPTVGRSR